MIVVVIYEDMPSQKIAMTVEDLRQQTLDDVYTIFANPLQSSQTFNAANKDGDKPEERMQSQMSFEQLYLWLP